MTENKTEKKLNLDIFEKSYLLDSDILFSLGSILINGVFEKKENFEKKNYNFKTEKIENIKKEDLSNFIKTFNSVNDERKKFRLIIKKMLKKKFWQTIQTEKNNNFFLSKIKGINLEILKAKILKFEKKEKIFLEKEKIKNTEIENLKKLKEIIENKLQMSQKQLKETLMCDINSRTKTKKKTKEEKWLQTKTKKNQNEDNILKLDLKSIRSKRLKTENCGNRRLSKGVKTSRKISLRKSKKERTSYNEKGDGNLVKKCDAFDYYGKYEGGKSSYESTFLF